MGMSDGNLAPDTRASYRTYVRWYVVMMCFLVSFLTIVDRVAISAAMNDMSRDLDISNLAFGWVFGVFALGYALFQIPSGWLVDRYGPRIFLSAIVLLWSIFTGWTGLVYGVGTLIVVRFLFGMAEAGAYPGSSRAFYTWLPRSERGLAQGILFTGSRLGAALGLSLMSFIIIHAGWRAAFLILAVVGLIWAAVWYGWFRDYPSAKRSVGAQELNLIEKDYVFDTGHVHDHKRIPWTRLFWNRNNLFLMTQYFASNFTFFICFSWLLPYLRMEYELSAAQAGLYASVPLYFGAAANWFSGATVDFIYRRGRWRLSRIFPAIFGFSLAVISLVAVANASTVLSAVIFFSLATFGVDLTLSPSWAACIDIGGPYTGTISGGMNMIGNLGSFVSSVSFPYLLAMTGTASTYFYGAAALNLLAIVAWFSINPQNGSTEKYGVTAE